MSILCHSSFVFQSLPVCVSTQCNSPKGDDVHYPCGSTHSFNIYSPSALVSIFISSALSFEAALMTTKRAITKQRTATFIFSLGLVKKFDLHVYVFTYDTMQINRLYGRPSHFGPYILHCLILSRLDGRWAHIWHLPLPARWSPGKRI